MVYSQDLEKQVIGGLIKHQDSYAEVASFIGEQDFAYDLNRNLFSLIKHALDNKETIDKTILTSRLRNLGITTKDNIDPYEYIDALTLIQVTPKSLVQGVKDLKKVTKRREYVEVADQIKKQMLKGGNMSFDEINTYVDKTLYAKMNSWSGASDSVDLFETMQARVEELGNNPVDDMGIQTPYPYYNNR